MSERCDRCKRGYGTTAPRDDVEWLDRRAIVTAGGQRGMRIGRCRRCGAMLGDLWWREADRGGIEVHDVCTVLHEAASAALTHRDPYALAVVSSQLRRRHLELLVDDVDAANDDALERIEQGKVDASEVMRGLATYVRAKRGHWELLHDPRPSMSEVLRPLAQSVVRTRVELDDGTRVVLECVRDRWSLVRVRGDASIWRADLPPGVREAYMARTLDRTPAEIWVLARDGASGESGGALVWRVDGETGAVTSARHELRVSGFEATSLPGGCTYLASYPSVAILRDDASVAWHGTTGSTPRPVPLPDGVLVIEPSGHLGVVALPSGVVRGSLPVDRGSTVLASAPGFVLLATTDTVSRLDVRGARPRLVWVAAGTSPLALADGGVALVRERVERGIRLVECVRIAADGTRRGVSARPSGNRAPVAELRPWVLVFHTVRDLAVCAPDRVSYALAVPGDVRLSVTFEGGGAWVAYDGLVERIDGNGERVGRWRTG